MKETKLMSCPFCDGEIFVRPYIYKNDPSIKPKYVAMCENPKCTCYAQSKIYNTIDEAIEAWNTRKPMERIIERLEENCFWTSSTFDEDGYCNDDSEEVVGLYKAIEIVKEEGWIE